jgi:hypothetical protein
MTGSFLLEVRTVYFVKLYHIGGWNRGSVIKSARGKKKYLPACTDNQSASCSQMQYRILFPGWAGPGEFQKIQ